MRRPLLLLSTLLFAACGDTTRSVGPVMGNEPSFAISDGANTGGGPANGDFFFLPPMVPDPSGSPAFDAGAFDPDRAPRVEICLLGAVEPRVCTETIRTFESAVITVSTIDEHYQVNWHTDEDALAVDQYYRIQVQLPRHAHDGVVQYHTLGFADLDPVGTGKELKNVATGELIGLVDGRTLPIKFRIERSPRCENSDDCVEAIVSNEGGRVETETGYAIAEFPAGWLPEGFDQVEVSIRRVAIGSAAEQEASCHGTAHLEFEGCYDFKTFPDVGTFAQSVVISTCIEPDAGANEPLLQLAASDDGANFRLLDPRVVTIECEGFEGTAASDGPISFLGRIGERALAFGARLGVALAPRKLYAVDKGRGGAIDGFSHGGWVLPMSVNRLTPGDEVSVAVVGTALPVSVMVRSAHESNAEIGTPLAGIPVTFSLSDGGGTLGASFVVTNSDGVASTTWTLGVLGQHVLTASAGGQQLSVTAIVSETGPFTLTFDVDPAGEPIAAGAVVNATYAPWNVTLRRIGEQVSCATESENVFANDHGAGGFESGQNNVTVCPQGTASDFNEQSFGRIEANFAEAASRTCIDVAPTSEGGIGFLEAYDVEGALLGRIESEAGVTETICVDQPGTRSVQFAGMGTLFAVFDNLSVQF